MILSNKKSGHYYKWDKGSNKPDRHFLLIKKFLGRNDFLVSDVDYLYLNG